MKASLKTPEANLPKKVFSKVLGIYPLSIAFAPERRISIVNYTTYTHTLEGKTFEVMLTDWAEQANGSVVVRLGGTMVLATAVMSPSSREGIDFFPLTVDYEEKFYATGKILGSRFVKRETRPSEEAILAGRLIDRAIRPRFDERMRSEVQVVVTVLSTDNENDPDIPALLASSLALSLSDIPWNGPIAGVRVGEKDGAFIFNPLYEERPEHALDIVVAGTADRINMIEAGANEISEDRFAEAVERGFGCVKELIEFQSRIIAENPRVKREAKLLELPQELRELLEKEFLSKVENALYQPNKKLAHETKAAVKNEWTARASELYPEISKPAVLDYLFDEAVNEAVHRRILEKEERPDGRKIDEVRKLSAEVGVLPRTHGSGLFRRGETHVLSTLTLGGPGDSQIIEGMESQTKRRFLHQYNFPPFSTGEIKPMRGPGRREIGHGALARRALAPMIPPAEEFPYTIRIVSEALSSNGSTSMGSVCGGTLALMDAGVPIKKPVAGAAMGLMMDQKGNYKVLTDIQGPEDHHGDMDFKVAGTRDGITAAQMDVKIDGITVEILRDALKAALKSRLEILEVLTAALPAPRPELKPFAPRIQSIKINPEKIGALIGPGGKVINEIIARTGVQIDIEDDGTVYLTSEKEAGMAEAMASVKQVTWEPKPGELVEGKVSRIFGFGAMIEIAPRVEGLIHISELAPWHVAQVEDILNVGDTTKAMVIGIDEQGRINLSLKAVPGKYSDEDIRRGQAAAASRPTHRRSFRDGPPRGSRGGRRGHHR